MQDDDEDKRELISNMNVIFQNSALTIISAAGAGLDACLPGVSTRTADVIRPKAMETIKTSSGSIKLALAAFSASTLLENSPWVRSTRPYCWFQG